jgi:Spondin_N
VKSTWTAAMHPFEYPEPGVLTGPHFSGLIGTAHNANYSIFAEGTPPTPGLEHLSEEGKHTPLDQEIQAAVAAGNAGMLVETEALRNFNDSLIAVIHVDSLHPLVSMVMMVAPSPDWFTGISSVNMMENGQWAATRTFDLIGWDSGGDDGTTYKAPDQDTNPKKPTSRANTPHFVINGTVVPVGTLTLTRM